MARGPGSFSDIGKKAKDLLFKDYNADQKLSLSTTSSSGVVFSVNGLKKGEALSQDVKAELKHGSVKTEVRMDTKSRLFAQVEVDEVAPGLKFLVSGTVPDHKSGKAEVRYTIPTAHITSAVGLVTKPLIEGSATLGRQGVVFGAEAAYDTATSTATKYNFGLAFSMADFSAAVLLSDKLDLLKASYLHTVSSSSSVAVEVAHRFSKNDVTFTAGGAYRVDPLTITKMRLNNRGTLGIILQHEFVPKSTFTLSGEVDSKALDNSAKVGVAINVKA